MIGPRGEGIPARVKEIAAITDPAQRADAEVNLLAGVLLAIATGHPEPQLIADIVLAECVKELLS